MSTDIWIILLRTVLMYFVVFAVMRLMGKREIGKLSVFDLVISIMIAEIAVFIIEDKDKSLIEGFVPLITLVSIQMIFAMIMLKSEKMRRWFDGKPSIMIKNGRINRDEMKKQKYNLDDLLLQLRMKDIADVKDVEFAILETNGSLSVFTKKDIDRREADVGYEGLPISLILDGKVQYRHLELVEKTEEWLKQKLLERGIEHFTDVYFCSIDDKGMLFIEKMDDST